MKKYLTKKSIFSLTAIFVVIIGIYYVYNKFISSKNTNENDISFVEYKVKLGELKNTVNVSGNVETANYLAIKTSVNGIVDNVYVKEGDSVVKGQKIMDITLTTDGQENLASAYSAYLSAQNSLDSAYSTLITKESAKIQAKEDFETEKENNSYQTDDERVSYKLAENNYLVANDQYEQQLQTIEQLKTNLNKAWLSYQAQSPNIVASDDGIIFNIVAVQGMEISNSLSERTSSTVASIKKSGTPIISVDVNEIDINKIQVGQKAEITLNSIENKIFTGEVVGIDRIGTLTSGVSNYPVIIKFDEDSEFVLPNMAVDVQIILDTAQNALYVPNSAIVNRAGGTYVRITDEIIETDNQNVPQGSGKRDGSRLKDLESNTEKDVSKSSDENTQDKKSSDENTQDEKSEQPSEENNQIINQETNKDISQENSSTPNNSDFFKQVTIGIVTSEYTQILSGLEEGETVYVSTYPTSGFTESSSNSSSSSSRMMMPGLRR